ncbi:uncharacterized protein LOC143275321 [Babylonia areolata]|uniref:uncharacterized protein LOC143275321 n=1 Tax=Babylonia areolata TaxID=304850 RepID=UPI003FD104E2
MSQTLNRGDHITIDCEIVLPRDFVREWLVLTTKQQWTAEVKKCDKLFSRLGSDCCCCSLPAPYSEGVSAPLETDTRVVADGGGGQKTYVSVKFIGVPLHAHGGTVHLTVLDIKGGNTNPESTQQSETVLDIKGGDTNPESTQQSTVLDITKRGITINPEPTEQSETPSTPKRAASGCVISPEPTCQNVSQRAGTAEESAGNCDSIATENSDCSVASEDHRRVSFSEGPQAVAGDSLQRLTTDGIIGETAIQGGHPRGDASKRKRGNTRTDLHDAVAGSAQPASINAAEDRQIVKSGNPLHSQSTEDRPQNSHHPYRLRGKKLSFAKFGSDFDVGEADDEDGHSPVAAPSVKKPRPARHRCKKNSGLTLIMENNSRQGTENQRKNHLEIDADAGKGTVKNLSESATPESRPSSAERERQPAEQSPRAPAEQSPRAPAEQSPRAPAEQSPRAPAEQSPRAPAEQSPRALAEQSPRALAEQSPRAPAEQEPRAPAEQEPTKKKRLKIAVAGLPTFARRPHNRSKRAECRYCRRRFCDHTGVRAHVRKFHAGEEGAGEYLRHLGALCLTRCDLCQQVCRDRFQLHLHQDKAHFKTGDMRCDRCDKTFVNTILLKQHVRSVHLVQGQGHPCSICNARFKWASTLKTHITEVHKGTRDLACNVCGKTFHRRAQLNRHAVIHGPEDAKLACHTCGRKFWYPSNLQRHLSAVHGQRQKEEGAWHCAYCGKGFRRREGWTNHVEKVHFSLYPHRCAVCGAGFIRRALLEKHLSSKHGQELGCIGDAAAAVRRRGVSRQYKRSGEEEGEKLVCGLCEEAFRYKAELVRHVFHAHRDTFPFPCHLCSQVFVDATFLDLHLRAAHDLHPDLDLVEGDLPPSQSHSAGPPPDGAMPAVTRTDSSSGVEAEAVLVIGDQSEVLGAESGDVHYVIHIPGDGPGGAPPTPSDRNAILQFVVTSDPSVRDPHTCADGRVELDLDLDPSPTVGILQGHGAFPVSGGLQGSGVHPDAGGSDAGEDRCKEGGSATTPPPLLQLPACGESGWAE